MCSIQFECCPSTTVTLGPIKNSLIILSLYLSTVFQSFRAGEKGYYFTLFTCTRDEYIVPAGSDYMSHCICVIFATVVELGAI